MRPSGSLDKGRQMSACRQKRAQRWIRRWSMLAAALLVPTGLATTVGGGAAVAATGSDVVTAVDFESGDFAPWTKSGSPGLAVEDVDGSKVLHVANRAADYDGIQSELGLFKPGKTYNVSMRVRLADGVAGTAGVRMVGKPAYNWIANTTMSAAGWTTVAGSWTPDDAEGAQTQLYIGTDNIAGLTSYDYLVDDIVVTGPPTGTEGEQVLSSGFESGLGGWAARGDADGDPT